MEQVLALRPFVPARDFLVCQRYYQALGFVLTQADEDVAFLKMESFSFILSKFYQKELAENFMMQMLVRDVASWWAAAAPERVAAEFGLRAPRPPAMQPWGMKVGFIFDPSSVLWHIAEAKF